MTRTTAISLLSFALVLGCGRAQTAKRTDQNYQVVQEGQASGVTSTINAPGETPPPMTNTAVDTTTNFTLDNPAPLGTQTTPNTVAGTLPAYPPGYPPASTTQPRVQPPPMSSATTPVPAQPRPRPQQPVQPPPRTDTMATTDTTATQSGPPATDTVPKTDTTKTDTTKSDTTKTDTQPPPTDTAKTDTTSTEKPPV